MYFGAAPRIPNSLPTWMNSRLRRGRAGFTVQAQPVVNTGHSWEAASKGLPAALDFLAAHWGIRP